MLRRKDQSGSEQGVGGHYYETGLAQVNGPIYTITRVQRRQEKSLNFVTLPSVLISELEVICICVSAMTRHQTHGCMDAALDATWLAHGPTNRPLLHTEV
jgi:hypothetical protein